MVTWPWTNTLQKLPANSEWRQWSSKNRPAIFRHVIFEAITPRSVFGAKLKFYGIFLLSMHYGSSSSTLSIWQCQVYLLNDFLCYLKFLNHENVMSFATCKCLLGEEAVASLSTGNTLWRVSTTFTSSAITPPEVNELEWNLGHSDYTVWRWPWQIWARSVQKREREREPNFFLSGEQRAISQTSGRPNFTKFAHKTWIYVAMKIWH